MKNEKRLSDKKMPKTFLLGAGFSKAVANGPLMDKMWKSFEIQYQKERKRTDLPADNNRVHWFESIEKFVDDLEQVAIERFNTNNNDEIKTSIKKNIEYLFTLIDLLMSGPGVYLHNEEVSLVNPLPIVSLKELKEIRSRLLTYLYIVLSNLNENGLAEQFSKKILPDDGIITFNYDLVLEKALWNQELWSPLNGYVGIDDFENETAKRELENAGKYSKLRIHKMHGSICWETQLLGNEIFISLDDNERGGFHFENIETYVNRQAERPSGEYERIPSQGYAGKYNPPWILPSFIKPFQSIQINEIWKSAIKLMSKTSHLVVIGYSFRPEDSHSHLLLDALPDNCEITIVDKKNAIKISEKLTKMGFEVTQPYKTLESFLSSL